MGVTAPSRGPAQGFSARFWAFDSRETRWTCGSSTRQQDDGYRRERNSIKPRRQRKRHERNWAKSRRQRSRRLDTQAENERLRRENEVLRSRLREETD